MVGQNISRMIAIFAILLLSGYSNEYTPLREVILQDNNDEQDVSHAIVKQIQAQVIGELKSGKLNRYTRRFSLCDKEYQDIVRELYLSSYNQPRLYFFRSITKETMVEHYLFYDKQHRLRKAHVGAASYSPIELVSYIIYFDSEGNPVSESKLTRVGGGNSHFPEKWPLKDVVILDPRFAFVADAPCPEKGKPILLPPIFEGQPI